MCKIELNQIYNMDCLEGMKEVPDESVNMILCDLPYGVTACKWDIVIPFESLWDQYNRIIKKGGAIVLFGTQPFTSLLINSNIKNFKHEWIWEKQKASNFMSFKYQPAKYHENILVFGKSRVIYYPIMWMVEEDKKDRRKIVNNPATNKDCHLGTIKRTRKKDDGTRYPKSIIKINKSINKNAHPTQKPVALFEYLIKTYTSENDVVLDNCIGSGTTAVACVSTNRNFIGFEIDENYFETACKRVEEAKKEVKS